MIYSEKFFSYISIESPLGFYEKYVGFDNRKKASRISEATSRVGLGNFIAGIKSTVCELSSRVY